MTTPTRLTWAEAERKSAADWKELTGDVLVEINAHCLAANGLCEEVLREAGKAWMTQGGFDGVGIVLPIDAARDNTTIQLIRTSSKGATP